MSISAVLALLCILASALAPPQFACADGPDQRTPPGFYVVDAAVGVVIYQKDSPDGSIALVQIVNLSDGAVIELLHGDVTEPGEGEGIYGGDNPTFNSQPLQYFWDDFADANKDAFCVTNGQFFLNNDAPTPLAFPLKKDGSIISEGYGVEQFQDQQLMLEIWPDRANIAPLSRSSLYSSAAPTILGGLDETVGLGWQKPTGRTFAGIDDSDDDGSYETVLIFNSKTASQPEAANTLRDFGADKVMMFDGGGSTQLICNNTSYVTSDRKIPQAIGISSFKPKLDYNARPVKPSLVMVLKPNQTAKLDIDIKNIGRKTWEPGYDIQLTRAQGHDLGVPLLNDLAQAVPPGLNAQWELSITAPAEPGLYQTVWQLKRGDKPLGPTMTTNLIVLSPEQPTPPPQASAQPSPPSTPNNTAQPGATAPPQPLVYVTPGSVGGTGGLCGLPAAMIVLVGLMCVNRRR